jgi:hypothetical protein
MTAFFEGMLMAAGIQLFLIGFGHAVIRIDRRRRGWRAGR